MLFTPTKKGKNIKLEKGRKTDALRLFLSAQSSKSSTVNQKEGPLLPQSSFNSTKVSPTEVQEGPLFSFFLD